MRTVFFATLAVAATMAAPGFAGSYSFTTLNPPGQSNTIAYEINDSGAIVGSIFPGGSQSFLYSGGAYTPLSVPQANLTIVDALNGLGQYAGTYANNNGSHGFVYAGGMYQTIDLPGASAAVITGLNDHGELVGVASSNSTNYSVSFSYLSGQFSTIAAPNGLNTTTADGVNNAGVIVGNYQDSNAALHGFVLQNGQYSTLDDPLAVLGAGQGTGVTNISNTGEIVGSYADANGILHGFVYQNGVFTTVDDPLGVGGTGLLGVNDLGQVVGEYTDASGTYFAFVATPIVPEPHSLTLLAVTGVALAVRRLRQRA